MDGDEDGNNEGDDDGVDDGSDVGLGERKYLIVVSVTTNRDDDLSVTNREKALTFFAVLIKTSVKFPDTRDELSLLTIAL
jgi:hypothetical protein